MQDVTIYGASMRSCGSLTSVPPRTRPAEQTPPVVTLMEPTSPSASAAHPPGETACMMPPSGASLRSGGSLTS
eukprot:3608341-Prymnesium_polylepis.1